MSEKLAVILFIIAGLFLIYINAKNTNNIIIFNSPHTSCEHERTLILLKPEAIERGLVGKIIDRFEAKGFKLVAMKLVWPTKELIEEHYSEHIHEHFYGKLVEHMISGPIIPMVWEGPDAVRLSHRMLGKSDPRDGIPGTIRGDFSIDRERSVVHGSHSIEAADREISMWFRRHEFTESHHAIHC